MPETIEAPFTREQARVLNAFQTLGTWHHFTCGKCGWDLVALESGWICPQLACDYTQNWAHGFMTDALMVGERQAVEQKMNGGGDVD